MKLTKKDRRLRRATRARAKIRVLVKRILKQYGYPPDLTESATALVLEQAELIAAEWGSA